MTEAGLLASLPREAFGFALLLCRVAGAVMLMPGLGETELPAGIRAALAAVLTALLLPVLGPALPAMPAGVPGLFALVVAEIAVGLWLGWIARMVMLALPLAGQIAASMLGLANVLQPDAALGPQTAALARLFSTAAPVLLFASGLYTLPLSALVGSYRLIPPGQMLPAGGLAQSAVAAVGGSFALALRLAAPFVLAGAVWQLAMGLVGRLVPNLQVYFAALPAQLLGGLVLLAMLAGTVLAAWRDAAGGLLGGLPGM